MRAPCRLAVGLFLLVASCADDNEDVSSADTGADVETPDLDRAGALSACEPVAFDAVTEVGACPFYRCADDVLGCGPDAYLIDFACRYADIYLAETYAEMSGAGQFFLESVFECLQTSLDREAERLTDCAAAAEFGFASHVPCYLAAGFCELPLEDKLLVFTAIDPEDLEHPLQRAAQTEVIAQCSER